MSDSSNYINQPNYSSYTGGSNPSNNNQQGSFDHHHEEDRQFVVNDLLNHDMVIDEHHHDERHIVRPRTSSQSSARGSIDGYAPLSVTGVTGGQTSSTGGGVNSATAASSNSSNMQQPTSARVSLDTGSRRGSVDIIPRLYAQARHSIDIVQQAQMQQQIQGAAASVEAAPALTEEMKKLAKEKPVAKKVLKKAEKRAVKIEEHQLSIPQVCELYHTKFNEESPEQSLGLTQEEAAQRLAQNGLNQLTPPKGTPQIVKFLSQFTSPFAIIPIVAGVATIILYGVDVHENIDRLVLALVLFAVTAFNVTVAYVEERKGEKLLEGFASLGAAKCRVIRDGKMVTIDVTSVVLGDLVNVRGGDKLAADVRLLTCNGLKADNASLTGEQEPQSRSVECTHQNPLETKNLMFYGTLAIEGEGIGIVVRTGDNTVIGQIANLAQTTSTLETPLRREINKFVGKIGLLAFSVGALYFLLACLLGFDLVENFVYAIGLIIANVPQGLIPTVTMLLTISAKKLGRRQVMVKRLESVETLGATTVIASDKTGTLTQNRMTVVDLWYDGKMTSVSYDRYMKEKPEGVELSMLNNDELSTFEQLQRCIGLCNRTVFEPTEENLKKPILDRECIGDASEAALLKYFVSRPDRADIEDMRTTFPKVFEIPFNSKNKWQLSIHKNIGDENGKRILLIKGAPERVIAKCSYIRCEGQELKLDDEWKDNFQQAYEHLAAKGERVLGFATMELDPSQYPPSMDKEYNEANIPAGNFIFLGLTGLMDPPKVGVPEAIEKCKYAGIQVIMVTGDHPATAKSIAKQVGIIEGRTVEDIAEEEDCQPEDVDIARADAAVIHGERIETFTDSDWRTILAKKQIVFARTSPQQKLEIVERLQRAGHIVAVTGDGVNDSPALRKADLGISMNITGSDVSKEAAAIILMDDNFASIVNGIEEGRLIFDNLKKSIAYTISHCMPEIVPFLAYVILAIPLPVSSILIIWIDLGTELLPAISLAYEKAEADIMQRPPRSKTDPLVSFQLLSFSYLQMGVLTCLACFFGYFTVFGYYGFTPRSLVGLSKIYFKHKSPFLYLNGFVYSTQKQLDINREAQSVYFLGIVMLQWGNILNCKTRINSLLSQGLFSNMVLWLGICYAAGVACFMFYVPWINDVILNSRPVAWRFWLCYLPWIPLIIIVDEIRKLLIRRAGFGFLLY